MSLNRPQKKQENRYLLKQAKLSRQQSLPPTSLLLRLDTSSQRFMLLMLVTASMIPNIEASVLPRERSQSDLLFSTHGKLNDVFAKHQNVSGTVCPAIPENAMQSSTLVSQKKLTGESLVLSKTVIEKSYANTLNSTQIQKEKEEVAALSQYSLRYPYGAKKIDRVFNSNNFTLTVVKEFKENPHAIGVYKNDTNTIEIRSPDQIVGCNDIQTTYNHELHHGDIINLRMHGNPLTGPNDEMTNPFTNTTEKKRLDKAISEGDKRVERFAKMHQLAMTGKLQNPAEIEQYTKLKNALSDYQPRCIGDMPPQNPVQLEKAKQKIKSGEKVQYGNLFVTHIESFPQGTAYFGYHIVDGQTSDLNQKAHAFIRDTAWRKNNFPNMYQESSRERTERLVTTEMDAEINANSQLLLEAFYPELVKYHADFRQKYEKSSESQVTLPLRQESMRPRI